MVPGVLKLALKILKILKIKRERWVKMREYSRHAKSLFKGVIERNWSKCECNQDVC